MSTKKSNLLNGLKFLPIAIIVIIILVLYKGNEKPSILEEHQASDIIFPSLFSDKENISVRKMLGKKYVIQFFATWCGYCMEEYDAFLRMEKKLPIYGILWRDDPENIKEVIRIRGNPFENIGLDERGAVSAVFNISVIPQTFVIDEKGDVIFHRIGAFDPRYLLKFF